MQGIEKRIVFSRSDTFTLYPIGDIHLGVAHCDEDLLKEQVAEIKSDKRNMWVGMGDYADLVTPSDFKRWDGRILADWMRGKEENIGPTQVKKVDEILRPIWPQCLGLVEGNHDTAIRKHTHYDFMSELLEKANAKADVPYAGVSCIIALHFRRAGTDAREYIIHARHGEGAARTSGARALAVLRLTQTFVNAHITLMGHLHGMEAPDVPQRLIWRRGKIVDMAAVATMTGAWIKAYMQGVPPCYLERWGSPPSALGCPTIKIHPSDWTVTLEKKRQIKPI